jgi:hypothetical protein
LVLVSNEKNYQKGCAFFFTLWYLMYTQIWLNLLMDGHHFGFIIEFKRKRFKGGKLFLIHQSIQDQRYPRPQESKFQHVIPGHSKFGSHGFREKNSCLWGLLLNIVYIPSLDNLGSLTPNLTFPWLILSSRSPYSRR